jgi:hypothetical protein
MSLCSQERGPNWRLRVVEFDLVLDRALSAGVEAGSRYVTDSTISARGVPAQSSGAKPVMAAMLRMK